MNLFLEDGHKYLASDILLAQLHQILLGVALGFLQEGLVPPARVPAGLLLSLGLQFELVHELEVLVFRFKGGLQLEGTDFGLVENIDEHLGLAQVIDIVLNA